MNLKYGQKVRVTSGFYEGMEGIVDGVITKFLRLKKEYVIEGKKYIAIIPESSLELIQ